MNDDIFYGLNEQAMAVFSVEVAGFLTSDAGKKAAKDMDDITEAQVLIEVAKMAQDNLRVLAAIAHLAAVHLQRAVDAGDAEMELTTKTVKFAKAVKLGASNKGKRPQ